MHQIQMDLSMHACTVCLGIGQKCVHVRSFAAVVMCAIVNEIMVVVCSSHMPHTANGSKRVCFIVTNSRCVINALSCIDTKSQCQIANRANDNHTLSNHFKQFQRVDE